MLTFVQVLDFIGTFAFAISGIRLASAKQFDWFGAYVVGLATAIGGGTIRDVLLDVTPGWMTDPIYLICTGLALFWVIAFGKYLIHMHNTFFLFDSIGLALFTVVGVGKSIALGYPFWVAIIMGSITGAAGGVLRDVFINEIPLIFRKEIYAMACVVVGVESERAKKLMTKLYKPFMLVNFRVIFMDIPSAEMTKYAANSMLATRISFMNDIANLCELVGADVNMVRDGIGSDSRIGRKFLYPGCGYGGSCFPKDVKALIKTAEQNGYSMQVLKAVEDVNENQKGILFEKLVKVFNGDLKGKTVALWGLAFKPGTDDMREAPALVLIEKLKQSGCNVRAYDPAAMDESRRRIGESVYYAHDMYDAALDADALILVTEWKEFRLPTWGVIKKAMKQPVVLDGRNIYDGDELQEMGFVYHCIGR